MWSCERIGIKQSSLLVESECFEDIICGYTGQERHAGSFIISHLFLGGGGVPRELSIIL